jgi:hypothetical protein
VLVIVIEKKFLISVHLRISVSICGEFHPRSSAFIRG